MFGFQIEENFHFPYRDGHVFFKIKDEQGEGDFIDAFSTHLRDIQNYCKNRNIYIRK